MPELPDVESFRRFFARRAKGPVRGVSAPAPEVLRNSSASGIGRALTGRPLERSRRHGKWMLAPVSGSDRVLVFHFGMTGELAWREDPHPHDRLLLDFDRGRLAYRSTRKLGGVWLGTEGRLGDVTGPQGLDARGISRSRLGELLDGRRGGIKSALMDQELIAGLGNELSDEILWRARLDPRRAVGELGPDEIDRLHACLEQVIEDSVSAGRIPREEGWLTGEREAEEPRCPRGHGQLRAGTVAGRTALWCERCQR